MMKSNLYSRWGKLIKLPIVLYKVIKPHKKLKEYERNKMSKFLQIPHNPSSNVPCYLHWMMVQKRISSSYPSKWGPKIKHSQSDVLP